MHNRRWAVYSQDGIPITIKVNTPDGVESMKFFANEEAAQMALAMMEPDDVVRYGAVVKEVSQA